MIADKAGDLFGTTAEGGGGPCEFGGRGTVFELTPEGKETVLYSFQGSDGADPIGSLLKGSAGDFYGTTLVGGGADNDGTVFKLTRDGTETVLYAFTGGGDGLGPNGDLIADGNGNLFGTTRLGGEACSCGVVFEVDPAGNETVLYAFKGGSDGNQPGSGLVADTAGNLYGVTQFGGTVCGNFKDGCGTVFKLAPDDGKETVLQVFKAKQGRYPAAALLMGKNGALYGTTTSGGGKHNDGVVFSVTAK